MRHLIILIIASCFLGFAQGQQPGLYSIDTLQEIRIRFVEQDWHFILDSLKHMDNDDRLIGHCSLNGVSFDSIGVRYKGNSSYNNIADQNLSKLPLNIRLDEVRKDQQYQEYSTLKLSNVFRDPSFLREVLSYEILSHYLAAPKANFIKVYVNDDYLGLYTNVESLNKTFLTKTFGTDQGNFFKCDPDWHAQDLSGCLPGQKSSLQYLGNDSLCYSSKYERKSNFADDWEQLIRLCRRLNHQPEKLEQILNINEVLWMHAYNSLLVNLDSYTGRLCHNYYLFRDSTGQFRPMIWDLNMSFGGFPFADQGKPLTLKEMQELNPLFNFNNKDRPLISQILANPKYRRMYVAHVRTMMEDFFSNGKYFERASKIQNTISAAVKNDPNKFYTDIAFSSNLTTSASAGKTRIVGIRELMEGRVAFLKTNPLFQMTPPEIRDAKTKIVNSEIRFSVNSEKNALVYLYYKLNPNTPFESVLMKDDGRLGDDKAGDGIYIISLNANNSVLNYYFYAESEKAGKFYPARAQKEYFTLEPEK